MRAHGKLCLLAFLFLTICAAAPSPPKSMTEETAIQLGSMDIADGYNEYPESGNSDDDSGSDYDTEEEEGEYHDRLLGVNDGNLIKTTIAEQIYEDAADLPEYGPYLINIERTAKDIFITAAIHREQLGITDTGCRQLRIAPNNYVVVLLKLDNSYGREEFYFDLQLIQSSGVALDLTEIRKISATSLDEMMTNNPDFKHFFMERSLIVKKYTESMFHQLLAFRLKHQCSWACAEHFISQPDAIPSAEECASVDAKELKSSRKFKFFPGNSLLRPGANRRNYVRLLTEFAFRSFLTCSEKCTSCYRRLPHATHEISCCKNHLCYIRYATLSNWQRIVERAVLRKPKVLDLLLSFSYAAAFKRDMNPFPLELSGTLYKAVGGLLNNVVFLVQSDGQTLLATADADDKDFNLETLLQLSNRRVRLKMGKGMIAVVSADADSLRINERLSPNTIVPGSNLLFVEEISMADDQNKPNYDALITVFDLVPSVEEMLTILESNSDERALQQVLNQNCTLIYQLINWVLSTNRANIEFDANEDTQIALTHFQFRIQAGSAEQEAQFQALVREERASNPQYKACFAFHGSPLFNWHSILRNGYNFDKVANGRVHGDGVYNSDSMDVSVSFAKSVESKVWPKTMLKGLSDGCVAVNQLIDSPKHRLQTASFHVMKEKNAVQLRYILIPQSPIPAEMKLASFIEDEIVRNENILWVEANSIRKGRKELRIPLVDLRVFSNDENDEQ